MAITSQPNLTGTFAGKTIYTAQNIFKGLYPDPIAVDALVVSSATTSNVVQVTDPATNTTVNSSSIIDLSMAGANSVFIQPFANYTGTTGGTLTTTGTKAVMVDLGDSGLVKAGKAIGDTLTLTGSFTGSGLTLIQAEMRTTDPVLAPILDASLASGNAPGLQIVANVGTGGGSFIFSEFLGSTDPLKPVVQELHGLSAHGTIGDFSFFGNSVTVDLLTAGAQGQHYATSTALTAANSQIVFTGQVGGIIGSAGDDVLIAGAPFAGGLGYEFNGGDGNDIFYASTGLDSLFGQSAAKNTIDTAAHDVVSYELSSSGTGVRIDLNLAGKQAVQANLWANQDTLGQIEDVIGTKAADTITGDAKDNVLMGLGGADTISGGDGNDVIWGDKDPAFALLTKTGITNPAATVIDGNDTLNGGNGNDEIHGGAGDDTINGDAGADLLYGDAGADTLNGGAGNDFLDGGLGADKLTGGNGNDVYVVNVSGDLITETTTGGTADEVRSSTVNLSLVSSLPTTPTGAFTATTTAIAVNVENATLTGSTALNINGSAVANILTGNSANNIINAGAGADRIIGGGGKDTMDAGANDNASDTFVFLTAQDSVVGANADRITNFSAASAAYDKIDISAFGSQANVGFSWVGLAAFTGTAGEVRAVTTGIGTAAVTSIYGDIDGNSQADFQIDLVGSIALSQTNFIF